MVRLRATGRHCNTCQPKISIPTWYDWEDYIGGATNYTTTNFNSNMVRLRVPHYSPRHAQFYIFQFQHGTIERLECYERGIHKTVFQFQHGTIESVELRTAFFEFYDFNSNMVRLRGKVTGTTNTIRNISIPTWYDWEDLKNKREYHQTLFQFQHGTIESNPSSDPFRIGTIISIPTWYDWERNDDLKCTDLEYVFQFQHGTIESLAFFEKCIFL